MSEELVPYTEAPIAAIADDTLVAMAEQAEKRVNAVNKIKVNALKVTNSHDWVDQQNRPYLQVSGAEKIARLYGVSWRIDEPTIENEEGGHFTYTYKGYFSFAGVCIEAIGTRSSKDGFFKRYAKDAQGNRTELPASEIDKSDVKKAAYTNCIGNGIMRLLGLRNLSWEELGQAGIRKDNVGKVEYQQAQTTAVTSEGKDMRAEIRNMILAMSNNDPATAKTMLEEFTSFTGTDGGLVKGKQTVDKLTDKQVKPTYGKIKAKFEEWSKSAGKKAQEPSHDKAYPADCTKNDKTCNNSFYDNGKAVCGDKEPGDLGPCPFA